MYYIFWVHTSASFLLGVLFVLKVYLEVWKCAHAIAYCLHLLWKYYFWAWHSVVTFFSACLFSCFNSDHFVSQLSFQFLCKYDLIMSYSLRSDFLTHYTPDGSLAMSFMPVLFLHELLCFHEDFWFCFLPIFCLNLCSKLRKSKVGHIFVFHDMCVSAQPFAGNFGYHVSLHQG